MTDLVERLRAIVRDQPFFPDTHTGARQQWVKDQILAQMEAEFASALQAPALPVAWKPTHRHKKSGGSYMLLGIGRMQTGAWRTPEWSVPGRAGISHLVDVQVDMREVAIYQGEDGKLWVRPREEFEDGRFEALPSPEPAPAFEAQGVATMADFPSDGEEEEARWIEDLALACPYCGGSGHKDDVAPPPVDAKAEGTSPLTERDVLQALADGRRIVYSQDGDNAWLWPKHPSGILPDDLVICLRDKGYIEKESYDDDEHVRFGPGDIISKAGRAALRSLPAPAKGSQG